MACSASPLNFECASSSANGDPLLTCSLRPHALFGPRDQHFVARLIAKARQGGLTHIIGAGACTSAIISQARLISMCSPFSSIPYFECTSGDNLVDFTYVDNAAAAHLRAADHLLPDSAVCGQCYFITNGEPVLFWDFVGANLAVLVAFL